MSADRKWRGKTVILSYFCRKLIVIISVFYCTVQ